MEAVGEVTVSERKSRAAGPGAVHAFAELPDLGEGGGDVLGVLLSVWFVESQGGPWDPIFVWSFILLGSGT